MNTWAFECFDLNRLKEIFSRSQLTPMGDANDRQSYLSSICDRMRTAPLVLTTTEASLLENRFWTVHNVQVLSRRRQRDDDPEQEQQDDTPAAKRRRLSGNDDPMLGQHGTKPTSRNLLSFLRLAQCGRMDERQFRFVPLLTNCPFAQMQAVAENAQLLEEERLEMVLDLIPEQ